jgi:hypothetical protein
LLKIIGVSFSFHHCCSWRTGEKQRRYTTKIKLGGNEMKVKLSSNLFIWSTTFRVLLLIGFLANVPTLLATNSKIVLKIQTKLGVETNVVLSNISTDDYILDDLVNAWDDKKLLLSIAEDVYIGIPIEIFQQAELVGNLHVVTFKNQSQVKGKLVCTIIGEDDKKYDLRTANKIIIVSTPKKSESLSEVKPIIPWQLHLNKPFDKIYTIFNPRFALRYYSSAGYMMGGSYRETQTTTFYIKIKEEEVVANLMDFKEV